MTHAFLLNETEIKKNCLMIYAPETIKKSLLDYCLNVVVHSGDNVRVLRWKTALLEQLARPVYYDAVTPI